MIQLKDITILRGNRRLFNNFNFEIQPGEHWVVQGANGSGKTSLLQLIAGLLHPTSGHVHYSFIKGTDWETLYRQRQEKLRFIPTESLQTFLNGYEGLFYQQRYYSMNDTELPKVRDVFGEDIHKLKSFNLSSGFNIHGLLDLELTRLSNGQLKKVLIMSHLIRQLPNFLLLDYPFDGLDMQSREDLSGFLTEVAVKMNIQIVMVDHDHALPSVINRRLVLSNYSVEKIETVKGTSETSPFEEIISPPTATVENRNVVVEMQNLTIQYSGKKIIENLNWVIRKGERWALTGKNGSGKTTLFSLIYADHPMAYSQKVFLFGKRRGTGESIWDIKKRINYLGPEQIHFLNPKGIYVSARNYILTQIPKENQRLNTLIDFFDAGIYVDNPVRVLSSGQLQMMLLMSFFLQEKELLLLDEPFQFLDPQNKEKATEYLNHYLNKEITLVLITHNENDVQNWTKLRKRI